MNKAIVSLLIVASVISFGARAYGENAYFVDNLPDAISLSEDTHKPVLLIFSAKWCKFCRILKEDLQEQKAVQTLDNYIVCVIDTDKNKDLSKEYRVKNMPDSRILKDKKEISQKIGYEDLDKYLVWINNASK